jgi:hypothetical protein
VFGQQLARDLEGDAVRAVLRNDPAESLRRRSEGRVPAGWLPWLIATEPHLRLGGSIWRIDGLWQVHRFAAQHAVPPAVRRIAADASNVSALQFHFSRFCDIGVGSGGASRSLSRLTLAVGLTKSGPVE